jgi:hypothetical protein
MRQAMQTVQVFCLKCNYVFSVHEKKTSRNAHLLHCVRCGRQKQIELVEAEDYFYRCRSARCSHGTEGSKKQSSFNSSLFTRELLDDRRYTFMVEHMAGSCICGAGFRFSAKPRCPRCRSSVLLKDHDRMVTDQLTFHAADA